MLLLLRVLQTHQRHRLLPFKTEIALTILYTHKLASFARSIPHLFSPHTLRNSYNHLLTLSPSKTTQLTFSLVILLRVLLSVLFPAGGRVTNYVVAFSCPDGKQMRAVSWILRYTVYGVGIPRIVKTVRGLSAETE